MVISDTGETLAVAAPNDDNPVDDSGAVYVFVRNGEGWTQQAYVKASMPHDHVLFGTSLAISGDGHTLAVASREDGDAGSVYVFVRNDGVWSQQIRLQASNPDGHDRFGASLSLSGNGDVLAVGASLEDSNAQGIDGDQANDSADDAGAAYVFARNDGAWSQQAYVKASSPEAQDFFGASVALASDGNTLAVGAHGDAGLTGSVYLFAHTGELWSQQAQVLASNGEPGDGFGESVTLSDDGGVLAVGARHESSAAIGVDQDQTDNSAASAGAVYVLVRSADIWSQQAYVKAPSSSMNDEFGVSVALSGDGGTLAVGARGEGDAGAVYLY